MRERCESNPGRALCSGWGSDATQKGSVLSLTKRTVLPEETVTIIGVSPVAPNVTVAAAEAELTELPVDDEDDSAEDDKEEDEEEDREEDIREEEEPR